MVDRLWSVDDVSAFLGVPVETLYQWRKRRYGPPAARVGRYLRAAEAFLVSVESDKLRGTYVDPVRGRMTFGEFTEQWLRTRTFDASTREGLEYRVRKHILPFFGPRELRSIRASDIREWDSGLVGVLAPATRSVAFAYLRAILSAAMDDERIVKNPCSAKSVQQPRPIARDVVPWKMHEVAAIRAGLAPRYRPMADLAGGCGMRQGEVFGVAVDDLDFDTGWIHVQRQVKRIHSLFVFGLPKNDKDRRIPLPDTVAQALKDHMDAVPPVSVTLPWEDPASATMVTARLVFTTPRGNAINRATFDEKSWRPAIIAAGIVPTRATGMHALRHLRLRAAGRGGVDQGTVGIPRPQRPWLHVAGVHPPDAVQ